MKRPVNPVAASIVILLAVVAIAAWIYKGSVHSNTEITDTQLPPEVVKKLKERGPQPMPAMPMPGGGASTAPGGTQNGPPRM